MTTELIELYDKTTVNKDLDKIPVSIILDNLGLNVENEIKKIIEHPILSKYLSLDGNKYVFKKKGFLIFILTLKADADYFTDYQEYLFEYLYDDTLLRETLTKSKIIFAAKVKMLEKEIENDAKFKQLSIFKDKLRKTETEFKLLNSRFSTQIQSTIDFNTISE